MIPATRHEAIAKLGHWFSSEFSDTLGKTESNFS